MEGEPMVSFLLAELDAGTRCFQFSLIAKFTIGRPSIDIIRQAFQANWDIKGRATLSEIWDGRHLFVILDSEEDMVTALTCPMRKNQHAMFRLFRYTPEYNPQQEATVTTKWIRLPGTPPPLFHRNYIEAIVNSFSTFLDIDDKTKACATMRYARACIESDVTQALPKRIWIALPEGKSYWQDIVMEGNLSYCSCKIHGHELSVCRNKKPALQHEANSGQGQLREPNTIRTAANLPGKKHKEIEWRETKHKKNTKSKTQVLKVLLLMVQISSIMQQQLRSSSNLTAPTKKACQLTRKWYTFHPRGRILDTNHGKASVTYTINETTCSHTNSTNQGSASNETQPEASNHQCKPTQEAQPDPSIKDTLAVVDKWKASSEARIQATLRPSSMPGAPRSDPLIKNTSKEVPQSSPPTAGSQ